jgi:hypothetical protein
LRNPFRGMRNWFRIKTQTVIDQLPANVQKLIEPVAKVIGTRLICVR